MGPEQQIRNDPGAQPANSPYNSAGNMADAVTPEHSHYRKRTTGDTLSAARHSGTAATDGPTRRSNERLRWMASPIRCKIPVPTGGGADLT
jgi:hypothetical protein